MVQLHPQLQQLLNLLLLLCVGKYGADIYLSWHQIVGILLFTFLFEHTLYYIRKKSIEFISYASLSTAIGVMLMMATLHYWIYFILIMLALIQKQFLHFEHRHFFNPSNFAVIAGLVFFYHEAHIVLGQLGDDVWLMVLIGILALAMLWRVRRWVIPVAFVASYLLFQYLFIVQTDTMMIMRDIYYRFYSVSFIVFIFFMITDPKTTPSSYLGQILFAFCIALGATLLDYYFSFRVQHIFVSLFFLTPLSVGLDLMKKKPTKKLFIFLVWISFLTLSAIIYIQMKNPYYLEM